MPPKPSQEEIDKIVEDYTLAKMTVSQIAKKHECSTSKIQKVLNSTGIKLPRGARDNFHLNTAALSGLSPDSAYFAGAVAATAKRTEKHLVIVKSVRYDKGHFDLLCDYFLKDKSRNTDDFGIRLAPPIYVDLVRWGLVAENKQVRKFPKWLKGHELEEYFWRGFVEHRIRGYCETRAKLVSGGVSVSKIFTMYQAVHYSSALNDFFISRTGEELVTEKALKELRVYIRCRKARMLGDILYQSPYGPKIREMERVFKNTYRIEFDNRK